LSKQADEVFTSVEHLLSEQETKRAETVFNQCLVRGETVINQQQLGTALSLWGLVLTEAELRNIYEESNTGTIYY
jgi:hypothetical protein